MTNYIQIPLILLTSLNIAFSQDSKTNSFGYWHDPDSWENGIPGYIENGITFLENDSINIRGQIILNSDLDITNSTIIIHENDTLIIQGNVNFISSNLLNKGVAIINGNGLAAESLLKNQGKIVITGNYDGINNTLEGSSGFSYVYGYSNSNVGDNGSSEECLMNDPELYHWVRSLMELLPVELLSFEGRFINSNMLDQIELKWTTIDEKNHDGFIIQRSVDAKNWNDIGWVTEKTTISDGVNYYSFYDNHFDQDQNKYYYRLKQVDLDGNYEIHDIIMVQIQILNKRNIIFPNPFNNYLTLKIPSKTEFIIYDEQMRKVLTEKNKSSRDKNIKINTLNWAVGTYFIQTVNLNTVETYKIIKAGMVLN
ncbi:T9SS type A sorting domain-containing protein [Mangrovivirga sp. M17]|uniref:T9SS type A sorting domain-containing protein n=1 Tax=Mangrovivirga halotolerans TaxID=2993936 RepID=A0ABT3RQI5_9BACT|nr:T9SS type A sorting domain-containing protein [Mangrovivirga halotolerans]MCX2744050.1 T9SS type A sorting domain-containing protein [Mangrovivirga halotolerans]